MSLIWVAILLTAATAAAAPAVKYDQRQEGDVNVRADLENFVILLIPTSPSSGSGSSPPSSALGLLDVLFKAMPHRPHLKHRRGETKKPAPPAAEEDTTQHFIESKTAPYHVDISRTRSHLAKLHPQSSDDEVLIAHSPTINLSRSERPGGRAIDESRAPKRGAWKYRSRNGVQAIILAADAVDAAGGAAPNPKHVGGNTMTLLGAELEQCGPGRERDEQGVCRPVKA